MPWRTFALPQATLAKIESLIDLTGHVERAEGFPPLLDALRQGHSATIDGAWGSSAGLVSATLARQTPHTLLVVIAHPRDLDGWTGDLASFSGIRPVLFPAWDNQPSAGVVDEVAGQRLRVLKQLEADE